MKQKMSSICKDFVVTQINPSIPRAKAQGLLRIDAECGVYSLRPKGWSFDAAERINSQIHSLQHISKNLESNYNDDEKGFADESLKQVEFNLRNIRKLCIDN